MQYELWDVASCNLITDVDSEIEAVDAARAYITASEDGPAVDVSLTSTMMMTSLCAHSKGMRSLAGSG
jgi:hypothetical protein